MLWITDPYKIDGHYVIRRVPRNIHPSVTHIKKVGNDYRATSAAFGDDNDIPLSVQLSECLLENDLPIEVAFSGESPEEYALAAILVDLIKETGLDVTLEPEDGQICHAHILGRKNRKLRRFLASNSIWLTDPSF